MLPPTLISTYREYQKELDSIAAWLASTAKECGYPLFGVELRSDDTIFIGILEKVRDLLKYLVNSDASANSVDAVADKLDALKVCEPSEGSSVTRPDHAEGDTALYDNDISESLEEALIAYGMLCEDLSTIRQWASEAWHKLAYEDDSDYDPTVLAVVTNTAVEFGRELINEVMPVIESHGRPRDMAQRYLEATTPMVFKDSNEVQAIMDNAPDKDSTYKVLSDSYSLAWNTSQKLANVPRKITLDIHPDGQFGKIDVETPWDSMMGDQKMAQDIAIISELWYETEIIIYSVADYPGTDEFIRGAIEFKESRKKEVPFSLAFAAQVTLDINHAIGMYAEASVETLMKRLNWINDGPKHHMNFEKEKGAQSLHGTPSDEESLAGFQADLDKFLADPLHQSKTRLAGNNEANLEKLARTEKWRLFKRSLIVSGLVLYYYRAEMHDLGLRIFINWGTVTMAAHLYNAILQEKETDCQCPDMKKLFSILGEEKFFLGGKPTRMDQYATRFLMQFGVSEAEATALLREPDEIDIEEVCSAGTRPVPHHVPVHQILRERYHKSEEQRGSMALSTGRQRWNGERIQKIISRVDASNSEQDTDKKTKEVLVEEDIRLTPTRFLAYLNDAMNLEKENLAFPYLSMNSTVWASLMTFKVIADRMVSDDFIYGGVPNELTPLIVGHILIQAPIQFPRVKVLEWMAKPLGLLIPTQVFKIQQLDKQLGRDFEPTPEVKKLIAENIERVKEFRDSLSSKSK